MIALRSFGQTCWWCGMRATSREHRHKRSDLIQEFGPGPYRGDSAVVRGIGGDVFDVQGPNSTHFKFSPLMCDRCNNARSQAFDIAYERYTSYVAANAACILRRSRFRWSDVYGAEWRRGRKDFLRYVAKHICCRMAEAGLEVGKPLIDFLDDRVEEPSGLACTLAIHNEVASALSGLDEEGVRSGSLWLGDFVAWKDRYTGEIAGVSSHLGYRWLWVLYSYDSRGWSCTTNFQRNLVRLSAIEI
jgi:hypothetical protein